MEKYFLYVLKSIVANRHYIGISGNVEKRLREHNGGAVRSTRPYRPWRVVRVERFYDKTSARKRELFLKRTARARKELFEVIEGPIV